MLHNFFDTAVPVDLFRGQPIKDFKAGKDLLAPDPGGRVMKDGTIRKADVRLETLDGKTTVLGCRCIKGRYRGISLGDKTPVFSRNKHWKRFRIPEGTKIPAPLAITKDADYRAGEDQPIHYTLAPKDTMEFGLFLTWLNVLAEFAIEQEAY